MKNEALRQIEMLDNICDFMEYLNEYQENISILQNYERSVAFGQLQKMLRKYVLDLNTFGLVNDMKVIWDVDYTYVSDYAIATQLNYINECIPIFALMRKGLEELAKNCFSKLVDSIYGSERR